jgi:membrane-associated phospholipid phosphatase
MLARKPSPPARTILVTLATLATLAAGSRPAHAATGPDELTYDVKVDLPITLAAATIWLGSDIVGDRFAPEACRWCASNGLDDGIRSALLWHGTELPQNLSNALAYGALPVLEAGFLALAMAQDNRRGEFAGNALVVGEAVAIAGVLGQLVKYTTGRERPFVHALPAEQKPLTDDPGDNNLSFYSAHTGFAFALASSAGSVATLRGYRLAPVVWVVGGVLALATGYLRIASDRHYFTDVLTGAVAGTAVGVGVPFLFHRGNDEHRLTLVPIATPGITALALAGVF